MDMRRCLTFWALIMFALVIIPQAEGGLRGEAFSDPSSVQEAEPGWAERPIVYKNAEDGVALSVIVNQQVAPVLTPLVERFSREKGIKLQTTIGTCGISAGALARKEADMGGFCCPPDKIDRLPGLEFHTLGITPLLILVHPSNPLESVTLEEARALFMGRITNWSQINGGPDMTVEPLGMLHCKKRPGHWRLLLDSPDLFSPDFKVTGDIQDTLSHVAASRGAVGFEIMMNVISAGMQGKVKALRIDGMDPMELDHLASGRYPLYRTMNITTWSGKGVGNPLAAELAAYIMKGIESSDPAMGVVPASRLRASGWGFTGDELTAEPAGAAR